MRRRSAGAWWAVTAAYGLALVAGSVLPSGEDAPGGWDKAISPSLQNALHVLAYAGLAWLACAAWSRSGGVRARQVLAVFAAAVAFGVMLEFVQAAIPGRTASAWDAVLNAAGCALGGAVTLAWPRWAGGGAGEHGGAGTVDPKTPHQRSREITRLHYHDRGWVSPYKQYEYAVADVLGPTLVVLEVGCGRAFPMAPYLRALAAAVHGVDPVSEGGANLGGAIVTRGQAERLPYADEVFDAVVLRCVLEYLADSVQVFRELWRVLRPGGRVVFLTAGRYDYVSIAARLFPNVIHGGIVKALEGRAEVDTFPTYYRANSVRQIREIARQTGFVAERLVYANQYPYLFTFSPMLCRLVMTYDKLLCRVRSLNWLQGWLLGQLRKEIRQVGVGATAAGA